MPLDPRIPLGVQPPPVQNPLEAMSTIAQLQGMREQTEARRLAADEAREKRNRQARYETAMQRAITIGEDGQPTIDFAKLLPDLDAGTLFEVKKTVDENAQRMAQLRTTNLTAEDKTAEYLAGRAREVAAAKYHPDAYGLGLTAAVKVGVLTQAQADQLLDEAKADPSAIQRRTDAAIARVTDAKTTTVGSREDYLTRYAQSLGKPVVALTPSEITTGIAEFEAAERTAKGGAGTKFQDVDAIVKFPDGKTYTGKVGYNPDQNVYAPIGSTEPFPPGTTIEKQPTPVDPLVMAIRGLTVQTLREQAATMTPAQATYAKALADDYTKASEDYIVRAQSHQTLKGAADNPSAAGDIVMIFSFMRQQDPKSTVREGEFATAQNSAGVPEQIRNLYNKVLSGTRLSPSQRADFVGQSERIFKSAQQRQQGLLKIYSKRAENMKLNPSDVVIDYDQLFGVTPPADTRTTPPPAGATPGGLSYQDYLQKKKK